MLATWPKLSFEELADANEGTSKRAGISYRVYVQKAEVILFIFQNIYNQKLLSAPQSSI